MSRIDSLSKKLLLILIALLLSAILLEGVARLYAALFFPKMIEFDDTLGWKHSRNVRKMFVNEDGEKNLVVFNAYGHRGGAHGVARRDRKFRILVLGDSITEGSQVDEQSVFSACLERADPRLEVINAGVAGYGTVQEYLYLTSEGINFTPDLVLLMFFENDLYDNLLTYFPSIGPRPYARLTQRGVQLVTKLNLTDYSEFILPAPFQMRLHANSYLYYFLNTRIYQRLFEKRLQQRYYADLDSTHGRAKFEIFYGLARMMRDYLKARNVDLVIALIPPKQDLDVARSPAQELITTFCRRSGIQCIPLFDRLKREHTSGERLYFRTDIHWTKAGHRIAASEIGDFLRGHLRNLEGSSLNVRPGNP